MWRGGALLTALVLGLSWWNAPPYPHDIDNAATVYTDMVLIKAFHTVSYFLSFIGVEPVTLMRLMTPGDTRNQTYKINDKDLQFDGVDVRVYYPEAAQNLGSERLKGVLYIHGGAWVMGSIEMYDSFCWELCEKTQAVVVSVGYRLAPEHPYPAALDDCHTAYSYFARNSVKFAIDPKKIIIMGDSAGGNIAAALALRLRDEAYDPMPRAQVLVYPSLQVINLNTPASQARQVIGFSRSQRASNICSYLFGQCPASVVHTISENDHVSAEVKQEMKKTVFNTHRLPEKYITHYVHPDLNTGNLTLWNLHKDHFTNPYISPLLAPSLENLPDTYLVTVQYDALRDEGYWFMLRLREAKVNVDFSHMPFGFHGILMHRFVKINKDAIIEFNRIVSYIKKF